MRWGKTEEALVLSWRDVCMSRHVLHKRCADIFSRKEKFLTLPSIVFSGVTGSTLVSTSFFTTEQVEGIPWLQVVLGVISLLSSILIAIEKNQKYPVLIKQHNISALDYLELAHTIESEMVMKQRYRSNCENFIKTTRLGYDAVLNNAPMIPDGVMDWFETVYLKKLANHYRKNVRYEKGDERFSEGSDPAPNPLIDSMFSSRMMKRIEELRGEKTQDTPEHPSSRIPRSPTPMKIPGVKQHTRFQNTVKKAMVHLQPDDYSYYSDSNASRV